MLVDNDINILQYNTHHCRLHHLIFPLTNPQYFGIEKDKLYITYHPTDKETKELWIKQGMDESHLIPLTGNFWQIGEGPCGPNTEVFFDRGIKYDKDNLIRFFIAFKTTKLSNKDNIYDEFKNLVERVYEYDGLKVFEELKKFAFYYQYVFERK